MAQPNFFLSYLVTISFPIEFDVWGRLCTHFEAAKVRTFATGTQHFSVSTAALSHPQVWKKKYHFFFMKDQPKQEETEAGRIVKERIQISHSTQGSSMYLDELVPLEDHQEEVVVLDVLECSPVCIYICLC